MALYAFDGTWNADEIDDAKDTNVCRFRTAYAEPGVVNHYATGVGTKLGWIGKAFGGAFGFGGWARVEEARKTLEQTWRGEPLVVIGFSRGAALALDFVHEISKGITAAQVQPPAGAARVVPSIRFLGLWDVVASFGIPGNTINLGYQLRVPDAVRHCCHAMSLDERRYTFGLTRVKYASDRGRANGQKAAHEVWFRGGHGDVGGGNRNPERSNIALRWMLLEAAAAGVPIEPDLVPAPLPADLDPPVKAKEAIIPKPRKPASGDRVHHTVERSLGKGFNDPPAPFVVEHDEPGPQHQAGAPPLRPGHA